MNTDDSEHGSLPSHKWLYIFGFNGSISPSQVAKFISYKLNCDDLLCNRLERRSGTSRLERRRVAYKVRVPNTIIDAVSPEFNWPSHLFVRWFVDNKDFIKIGQGMRHPLNQ